MSKNQKRNSGKEFEELVSCIQRCLHNRAEIKTNIRIKDVDTGRLRQIDIGIYLSDGPTKFFALVEVRDRVRPIGVRYVEEISAKRQSVCADAAFLVSRSGFTKTALTKAEKLGIRTFSFEEAKDGDWSTWLHCKTITVLQKYYDNVNLTLFEYGSDRTMNISKRAEETLAKDPSIKLLKADDGKPLISINDFVKIIMNFSANELFKMIPKDGSKHKRGVRVNQNMYDRPIYIENPQGELKRVGSALISAECSWKLIENPLRLMKYQESITNNSLAEVAATDILSGDVKYRLEFMAETSGEFIPKGGQVFIRAVPLDK